MQELITWVFYYLNSPIMDPFQEQEPRLSYVEGARDVAVLEAMLESGAKNGAVVPVNKF